MAEQSVTLVGHTALQEAFKEMTGPEFGTAMRGVVRKSATRIKREIFKTVKGGFFDQPTGNLRDAFKKVKVTAKTRRRTGTHQGFVPLPRRVDLGIPRPGKSNDSKWYYPAIVEYGHPGAAPKPWIRRTVNKQAKKETVLIGRDIAKAVERLWKKRLKKAVV